MILPSEEGDEGAGNGAAAAGRHDTGPLAGLGLQVPGSAAPQPQLVLRASVESQQQLQAPIVQFIAGSGGGTGQQQLSSFFQRLGATQVERLPAAVGRVRLVREWGDPVLRARLMAAAAAAVQKQQQANSAGPSSEDDQQQKQQKHEEEEEDVGPSADDEQFLVLNSLGAGSARDAALAAWKESQRKFIPWVGVAAPLVPLDAGAASSAVMATASTSVAAAAGRAFCFLPLPVTTGLPVAVNGYFELSSNRRDIWHGEDMAGAGAARARWNEALLADAVAPAYLQLLLSAARELGPSPAFWSLFPGSHAQEPWASVARSLYRLLASQALLWCPEPAPKGTWLTPSAALLPDADALVDERLAKLMLACGVPLAMGLRAEAEECVLKWTPGAAQVCWHCCFFLRGGCTG